jgi:agmatine deiminase
MDFRAAILITLMLFIICANAGAETVDDSAFLPIGPTPEELKHMDEVGKYHRSTAPPPGEVRNCAEWERSEGVIIRWPLGISVALIAELSEDLMVTTLVGSTSQMNTAISAYTSGGVNMDNTQFIIASTNSIWTRDYGPWFIFDGNNEMAIVDHIYNRPRPLDDQIPWIIGSAWGMDVFGMDLIHTGGNHMSDGLGISMSTELVYDENPSLSDAEVDSIMLAFVGNDYIVLNYVEYSGIHHIDCWAKFLSPDMILVKDAPVGDYSHDLLNQRAEFLSQQMSSWGRPYSVVRVYCPSGTAYTNSIILNRKVFVPIFNSPYDTVALRVYEEAMPGYEILGFTGSWYEDDAIHCRIMGVPDREMLYIEHTPLHVVPDTAAAYQVGVRIVDYSNQGLIPESLKVYYSTKGQNFLYQYLSASADPDSFYGYIPAQPPGAEVYYFIKAADSSGRIETHPFIGAAMAHRFHVDVSPVIIGPDTLFCPASGEFAYYPEISDSDDSIHQISYYGYPDWLSVQEDTLLGNAPESSLVSGFAVEVADEFFSDERNITLVVYICGDVDFDSKVNILDIAFLINYLYREGPEPFPAISGDVNANGVINILDVTHLIDFLYNEGAAPNCQQN